MPTERASRIYATTQTPGWDDIMGMLAEQMEGIRADLFEAMTKRPETLTGRKCMLNAGGLRALEDFRGSIADEVGQFAPNRIGRARKQHQAGASPNHGE